MSIPQITLDSNVLVAALLSNRGASFKLLSLIGTGRFDIHISVPLVLEYEDVSKRLLDRIPLEENEVDDILDFVCSVAKHQTIFYLWRPFLPDPKDDMVLELAVAAGCERIVTFNRRDFRGSDQLGVTVMTPQDFLKEIGEIQ